MAKISCNVISYTLKRTVDIDVILPTPTIPEALGMSDVRPSHVKPAKHPVVYLLHGFGNNQKQICGYTNIEAFCEERQIAAVMIAAENKSYVNFSEQDLFYDFIEKELPEFITNTFPISDRKEDTYIAGLSMGGYGAALHGLSNPNRYNAVGAFSAAFNLNPYTIGSGDINNDTEIKEEMDLLKITNKLLEAKKQFPKMYIACGTKDFLYNVNKNYVNNLVKHGIDVTFKEVEGYAHEWRFWNICFEKFLDWIPRTDYYADKIRSI